VTLQNQKYLVVGVQGNVLVAVICCGEQDGRYISLAQIIIPSYQFRWGTWTIRPSFKRL